MKKYLKALAIRILVFIIFLILPLILIEFILSKFDTANKWYIEDNKINQMNIQKLKSYKVPDNGLWLHKNEELAPKKEGIRRILIVGDSYIWGDGYSNANHIWWKQFKHMLKEEGYENIEVIAAGVGGYSTKEELDYILKDKEMIRKIDPDLIILGYVNNDIEIDGVNEDLFLEYGNINMHSKYKSLELLKRIFPNIYKKFGFLLISKYEKDDYFQSIFGLSYHNWLAELTKKENMDYYENNVLKELDYYIRNEIKVPYIYYYTAFDSSETGMPEILQLFDKYNIENYSYIEESNRYGVKLVNDNVKINPVNWHPSVKLSQSYAKVLLSILKDKHKDFLGEPLSEYKPAININDWMPYSLLPERVDETTYNITYPKKGENLSFLNLPVKKDYVKLNLEDSIKLNEILIQGENIEEITLWINVINSELGYDDQVMIELGKQSEGFLWQLDGEYEVTSININAKIKFGKSEKLVIKLKQ